MFNKSLKPKSKNKAQAMVEFALVLPILLLVVYGLLEAGRLLFIFASVNTASRQAARYGSAIGMVDTDGDGTFDVPHYEDCAGITAAANNVAFIAPFTNVNITYDAGLNASGTPDPIIYSGNTLDIDPANGNQCPSLPAGTVVDGDRVSVYVSADFNPIIPLVPLGPMTIESSASRTIVGEVSIHVTAQPASWIPSSGSALSLSLEITPSPATYSYVGDKITYTYKITNIGSLDVNGPFSVTDDTFSTNANCSGAAASLAPDEWTNCTYTYTITQADIDNGSMTNLARALGTGATSEQANATINFAPDPQLSLLSIIPNIDYASNTSTEIIFTYAIENIGNVSLNSFSVVDSNMVSNFSCVSNTLQAGDSTTCTGSYFPTSADLNNGSIDYVAGVQAGDGTLSNLSSAFVLTSQLYLVRITPNLSSVNAAGQVITFTYEIQNKSDVTINPISITVNSTNVTPNCTLPLAAHGTTTCTSTYTVQQPNMDTGGTLTFEAIASGGGLTSNRRSTSVTIIQTPSLQLTISATPNPALVLGTQVKYTYTLKNNGNVSLKGFTISEQNKTYGASQDLVLTCSDLNTLLAPGDSRECFPNPVNKMGRTINDVDIANGTIITQARATAYYGPSNVSIQSNLDAYVLITFNAPRITLILTADPVQAAVGQEITFTFLMKNTGNADLSPFLLTKEGTGTNLTLYLCDPIALEMGGEKRCTANHLVSDSDGNAGEIITTWKVTASPVSDPSVVTTSIDSAKVTVEAVTGCDPRHSQLLTSPYSFTIFNNGDITITISEITINWNNSGGNGIDYIEFDGTKIYNGDAYSNPVTINTFIGSAAARTISAGGNNEMVLYFKDTYVPFNPMSEWVQVSFVEASCSGKILNTNNPGQLP